MRLKELHIYQHELPVKDGPYTMANQEVRALDSTLVRLISEDGHEGWGETCPLGPTYAEAHGRGARAALEAMGDGMIGVDLAPLTLHRAMDARLAGHSYAKAAVDIAAHDLIGKALGLSVAQLLGGVARTRLPSYYALGLSSPDKTARRAGERLAEGYPRLQLKIGGRAVETDIETIRKVWEVTRGRVPLVVDANRGLTLRDAIRLSEACRDLPLIIEQPCPRIADLKQLRPKLHHPLYMDESAADLATVLDVVGDNLVDGFGMKLTRIGGLHPMTTLRDICAARALPHTCDDSWGGDIIAAACTHVGATVSPHLLDGVWIAAPYIDGHYCAKGGVIVEAGHIALPDGPGLGLMIDPEQFGTPVASFGG
ncbi:mandelate racemase [Roseovarius faecimaris]|uniref:Mandelate racemase n=1 Tax=Roseovarius faecimaris TaxID=2494550 RepID=A0A6I6ILY6_9RHOB|nr:enolase C-terminal domain-like protein [Roseovarius faecimaris]QGX97094.1 mandelate racemase [Roseovarius faecimaris]